MTTKNFDANGANEALDASDASDAINATDVSMNIAGANSAKVDATNGSLNVFKYFLNQLGQATLITVLALIFIMLVINIAFNYFGTFFNIDEEWLAYPLFLRSAIPYMMLVLGIITPCYMELLLGYGITRRQQSVGLLGAAAVISIVTAVVYAVFLLLTVEFSLSQSLGHALSNWFWFLTGWIIVLGYLYRRVLTAIASTLAGVLLLGFWSSANPWIFENSASFFLELSPALLVVFDVVFCLLLAMAVVVLNRRIAIKI